MRPSLVTAAAVALVLASACPGDAALGVEQPAAPATITLPPAEHFAGPWPREKLTVEQMERLVGPIALYPDPLLAQVLPASTYPLEIVRAARLVRQGADEAAIAAAALDASVQAVSRHPEVVFMMDEYLDWTERLGQAFVEQPDDVMSVVQRLRIIAREFGNLATTTQQEVIIEKESVRIVPVTEYVYVPYYEPTVVYYRPCPTTYSYVSYRSCGYIGPWYDLDCDWGRRVVCRRDGWSWRRYCERRCSNSGFTLHVNVYDDDDCRRPVHDWRRDEGRRDHSRGGRHDDDRWARAEPRAAAPNPPTITAPRPAPRERDRPRPDRPRPAEPTPPPADTAPPAPAPEVPTTRPDRPPRSAEPAMRPITRPSPSDPPSAAKPDKRPAARDRKPDRPVEARRTPPVTRPAPGPTPPPQPAPSPPGATAPDDRPTPPPPAAKPRTIRSAEPRPPVITAPPPKALPKAAPPRATPAPERPSAPPVDARPPKRIAQPAPPPPRRSTSPTPAARPAPKAERPAAQRPAERPASKTPAPAEARKPAAPTAPRPDKSPAERPGKGR